MSLMESSGALSRSTKELFFRWAAVKGVWADARSADFEKTFLEQIEQDVRVALSAMDHMNQILSRIDNDCE